MPWTAEYNETSFQLDVTKEGPVVIILSQPDDRYFKGLEGRFRYQLHFRLYREGEYAYLVRSMEDSGSGRSCSAELTLEKGTYFVKVKVTASRIDGFPTREEIIRQSRDTRREKLLAVGKSFDLAHSKGRLRETEEGNAKSKKTGDRAKEVKKLKNDREQMRSERQRKKLRYVHLAPVAMLN